MITSASDLADLWTLMTRGLALLLSNSGSTKAELLVVTGSPPSLLSMLLFAAILVRHVWHG